MNFRDVVNNETLILEKKISFQSENVALNQEQLVHEDKLCVAFLNKIFKFVREKVCHDDLDII